VHALEIVRLGKLKLFKVETNIPNLHLLHILAEIYEQRYPALFSDVSSQIKLDSRFITRDIIANTISNFGGRVSSDGRLNWFRIVSVFCFASSIAMDCKKRQDSSIFVEMIPDIG